MRMSGQRMPASWGLVCATLLASSFIGTAAAETSFRVGAGDTAVELNVETGSTVTPCGTDGSTYDQCLFVETAHASPIVDAYARQIVNLGWTANPVVESNDRTFAGPSARACPPAVLTIHAAENGPLRPGALSVPDGHSLYVLSSRIQLECVADLVRRATNSQDARRAQ